MIRYIMFNPKNANPVIKNCGMFMYFGHYDQSV